MAKWTKSFSSGWATLILEVTESGTSAATNKGTISWSLKIKKDKSCSSYNLGGASISVTIGGIKRWSSSSFDIRSLSVGSTKALKSGSFTATHKTDGTLSLECNATFKSGVGLGNAYISDKTFTAETIPRKSSLTIKEGTMGVSQTLTIKENASAFVHKLYYACGTYSSYILGSASGASDKLSIDWTPPLELAEQTPNATSINATFTLQTYNGSTLIGSNTYTVKLNVPDSVKPTIESFEVTDGMGYASFYGAYIQSKSTVNVNVDALGVSGSTITGYEVKVDGQTYKSSAVTTPVISGTGTLTVTAKVTDSRGRTAESSQTIEALSYVPPKITDMKVKRSNADGTSNSTGEHLTVIFSTEATPLNNKNGVGFIVQYKKVSETAFASKEVTAYKDDYTVTNGSYTFSADTASSYDVRLSVADHFVGTIKEGSGSTASVLFSWMKKGLGWAFGKVAELENVLDVAFETLFRNHVTFENTASLKFKNKAGTPRRMLEMLNDSVRLGYDSYAQAEGSTMVLGDKIRIMYNEEMTINGNLLVDWIVESGVNGNWTYRKYASGKVEAWASINTGTLTFSAAGNVYRSASNKLAIPSGIFSKTPELAIATIKAGGNAMISVGTDAVSSTELSYQVYRYANSNASTPISFYVMQLSK